MSRRFVRSPGTANDRKSRCAAGGFEALDGYDHLTLTTFRADGEAVTTTVWFLLTGGHVYVTTPPRSGKVKRIRNDPRVVLAPSSAWGKPLGASVEGIARILEDGQAPEHAERSLRKKYRLGLALFRLLGRREIGRITLEIRAADGEAI